MLCTSVNSEVVHGIPSPKRVLKEGDIVSLDFGAVVDGYYGDAAITVPVGEKIDPDTARLLTVTEASLQAGIAAVRPGATLGDVGAAVQGVVEAEGFSVVRDFVGHGIGVHMHEDPQVPNFGEAGPGHETAHGHGDRHRAHGECGQAGCSGFGRRLDGSRRGRKHERSF